MMENKGWKRVRVTGPIAEQVSRRAYKDPGLNGAETDDHLDVDRVTDLTKFTVAETSAVTYGNEV